MMEKFISITSIEHQTMPLQYRQATKQDVEIITELTNISYRGDASRAGWTTEADLLTGDRINSTDVAQLIGKDDSMILLCLQDDVVVGSVHLKRTGDSAYLGMFVVQPVLQGGGIGKQFMEQAERAAQTQWNVKKIWMNVISVRSELIAYYQRRGYVLTGRTEPFPEEVPDERLLVKNLQFVEMEKRLV